MILADGTTVRTGNGVLVWNGLQDPEVRQSGTTNWNISVAFKPGDPTLDELKVIADQKLIAGQFKGVLPHGAKWPLGKMVNPEKIPELDGYHSVSFGTGNGVPPLFNAQGQQIDIMQAAGFLYPGCVVQVLCDIWDYNNVNKGLSFGLLGLMFIDTKAPKLSVGGGLSASQVAAGFGVGQAAAAAPAPGPAAPGFAGGPPAAPVAPPAAPIPAGPVMLPAANGVTYVAYITAGWTDAQLIEHGYMQA